MKLKHMKSNHLQNAAIVRKTAIKDKEKKKYEEYHHVDTKISSFFSDVRYFV